MNPKDYKLNVALDYCFFCGEAKGVVMGKKLIREDSMAQLEHGVYDMDPCASCADAMKQGIMLIRVREETEEPYRTGEIVVVQENAMRQVGEAIGMKPEDLNYVIQKRWAFVPAVIWDAIMPEDVTYEGDA